MFVAGNPKPFIVAVCVARGPKTTAECVRRSIEAGADIVEVNLAQLADAAIREIRIDPRLPYYVACRRCEFMRVYGLAPRLLPIRDDKVRMGISLEMIERGARALDMECDCFADGRETVPDPLPPGTTELASSAQAVASQRRIIEACRRKGREVILSCHSGQALTANQTLALGRIMERRGAAVIKIVNRHRRPEYATEIAHAILKFKQRISAPFLIASMGPLGDALRLLGCALGNSYVFCRAEGASAAFRGHPPISAMSAILKALAGAGNRRGVIGPVESRRSAG